MNNMNASNAFPNVGRPYDSNTNIQTTQQTFQGNSSTHSVFPWM